MDINEYQSKIRDYVDYPLEVGPYSTILSLTKNLGVLSSKLNNVLIKDHGNFDKRNALNTIITLGDILFDISNMASDLGYSMSDVISLNLMKYNKEKKEESQNKM